MKVKVLSEVLKRPLVTEKATAMKSSENKIVLEVAMAANKKEVKLAAEKLFSVSVDSVNISISRGKAKRVGKTMGRRNNWKKAVLTLKNGSDIDAFGVVAADPAA
jgi:large subunit ribosomal protein L23